MANHVTLTGRLTKTPELKYTKSEIPVVSITLAVEKTFGDGVDFIPVVFWRKQAEIVAKYLTKGSKILVEGAITNRSYETDQGQRQVVEVVGNRVEFLESKGATQKEQDNAPTEAHQDFVVEHETLDIEDDLPF